MRKEHIGCRNNATKKPLYKVWRNIMQRCYNKNNPDYKSYGGRGIQVCKEWHDFETFEKDVSPRPDKYTLDRINNNGNYSKENCRWATQKMQMANTRNSELLTANNLAKLTGVSKEFIRQLTCKSRKPLEKFIIERIQMERRMRIIYNEGAIEFMNKKLYLKKFQDN